MIIPNFAGSANNSKQLQLHYRALKHVGPKVTPKGSFSHQYCPWGATVGTGSIELSHSTHRQARHTPKSHVRVTKVAVVLHGVAFGVHPPAEPVFVSEAWTMNHTSRGLRVNKCRNRNKPQITISNNSRVHPNGARTQQKLKINNKIKMTIVAPEVAVVPGAPTKYANTKLLNRCTKVLAAKHISTPNLRGAELWIGRTC